jgi:hypothetical protein
MLKFFDPSYWGALKPTIPIPFNSKFTFWGRNYIVKTATNPSMGRGLFAAEDIIVPEHGYVPLFPYFGPYYSFIEWHRLSESTLHLFSYLNCYDRLVGSEKLWPLRNRIGRMHKVATCLWWHVIEGLFKSCHHVVRGPGRWGSHVGKWKRGRNMGSRGIPREGRDH